ncbi:pre-mRNA cleavage and polyadenylation factor I subunit [Scheffersomyces stipitis CBS 6054]|uniref:Pre-mRNA cleavage and polyadenylation factor I subunit n=1 Tax=Scheffersomyces stipitis (strain ATCC 58785 / CBS 6054 / NBRC 10063 / NRRL Y-11545) TaxID=322104 RepID=A3LV52_PICST|nr:pre-mRNA cleavage and polyadenylation factor I subunit [Scheffersomyces stipitis CBS 6054]ABN67064.2 pre-mRNA cleavage and polyadenylation factor I subunit [Scheffersomyces stipitis CBS 6054]
MDLGSDNASTLLEDYAQSVSELTFNSRPIIDNLTTIAQENPANADGILNIITNRIYKAIPDQKLYALYLLDSICKTAGNPYNILVGDDIFKLFSHVFQLGNETIRNTLSSKLFESWKVTKVRGNFPLFPREQLDKIKTFLDKAGYPKKNGNGNSPDLSNMTLIEDTNSLIAVFQSRLQSHPDAKLSDRFNALQELKKLLLSQQMKPAELKAVQAQLNTIKEQDNNHNSNINTPMPTPATTPAATPGASRVEPVKNEADTLFQALLLYGLVKVDQDPIPGSKPDYSIVLPKIKYQIPKGDLSNSALQDILTANLHSSIHRSEYEKIKFGELQVVSKQIASDLQGFLNNNKPRISDLNFLYDAKSSKCALCGKRFSTDTDGATKKRLHLDWHFRINKKLSSSTSNVQSRNWYLDDYDWVNFKDDALLEFSTSETGETKDAGIVAKTNKVAFVAVPANDSNMNNRCIICRESVKATYNDELGEWCWFNCVRAPGEGKNSRKIMHASCAVESSKKRGAEDEVNGLKKQKV